MMNVAKSRLFAASNTMTMNDAVSPYVTRALERARRYPTFEAWQQAQQYKGLIMDHNRKENIRRIIQYSNDYYSQCEQDKFSDVDELWNIIKMFEGACQNILDFEL